MYVFDCKGFKEIYKSRRILYLKKFHADELFADVREMYDLFAEARKFLMNINEIYYALALEVIKEVNLFKKSGALSSEALLDGLGTKQTEGSKVPESMIAHIKNPCLSFNPRPMC